MDYDQVYLDEMRCSVHFFSHRNPKIMWKIEEKILKQSEKNKSNWDDLKHREMDQSLPKSQDLIPFPERYM